MCRVHRLPQPLPIPSLGHVNSYAIQDPASGSWVLVDPGYYSARSLHALLRMIKESKLDLRKLEYMIATHFHVDHISLAGLLHDLTGAPLYVNPKEARIIEEDPMRFIGGILDYYRENGMPPEEVDAILEHHPLTRLTEVYTQTLAPLEKNNLTTPLKLGDCTLTPHPTPGHTPGHTILEIEPATGRKTLVTGDHVLPHITPHVIPYEQGVDQLGLYLESLRETARKWPHTTGLPGHREPMANTAQRALELVEHHHRRLGEVLRILQRHGALTAHQVARLVRWRTRYQEWEEYPPAEKFFAMGEALAHLLHLQAKGEVEAHPRDNMVYWKPA